MAKGAPPWVQNGGVVVFWMQKVAVVEVKVRYVGRQVGHLNSDFAGLAAVETDRFVRPQ